MQCSRPRRRSTRGSRCPTRAACTCFASSRASVISLRWARRLPWLITAACFAYLGVRLDRAAAAEGQRLFPYLAAIFAHVAWSRWLTLMIPYCALFLLVDSLVVWRVTGWFNARLRYRDVLPIRASAYILSIVNEQVSKGAIALYLSRRHGIPAWEVGSSMLFIMFCEYYYLLGWATLGVLLEWDRFPTVFHAIPWIALGSAAVFAVVHLFFRGRIGAGLAVRERPIFRAFRMAKVRHYAAVLALRSPAMLAAGVVYAKALRHREHRAHDQRPDEHGDRGLETGEPGTDENIAAERREVEDAVIASERARAERAPAMHPVRVHDVLREGRRDEDRQDPGKGAADGARHQAAGHEETVGRVVERSAGGGDRVSAARERAVEHIRRDGRGQHERGERRVTRAAAGHEERERQGQQNARGRQRVRHCADGRSHDQRS